MLHVAVTSSSHCADAVVAVVLRWVGHAVKARTSLSAQPQARTSVPLSCAAYVP